MWVKWLRRVEVTDQPIESREETSKYTDTLADGIQEMDMGFIKSVIISSSLQAH